MTLKDKLLYSIMIFVVLGFVFGSWNVAYAGEEGSTAYYDLFYQEPADVYLGKGGVFMVSSSP